MRPALGGRSAPLIVRHLGLRGYLEVFEAMKAFTAGRDAASPDELWCVEHPPVFTLGLNCRPEHLLAIGEIPAIQVDRGGQVTYHGPGQAVVYCLLDLRRSGRGVRNLVTQLEQSVVDLLAAYGIAAHARADAPGVYVGESKVASLGLRVRRGGCYHGLSLNVDMDLEPFQRINPCGYPGLRVTQLRALGVSQPMAAIKRHLLDNLASKLDYTQVTHTHDLPHPLTLEAVHAPSENTA
jgi:lipoyl(octanoyl) transferase